MAELDPAPISEELITLLKDQGGRSRVIDPTVGVTKFPTGALLLLLLCLMNGSIKFHGGPHGAVGVVNCSMDLFIFVGAVLNQHVSNVLNTIPGDKAGNALSGVLVSQNIVYRLGG